MRFNNSMAVIAIAALSLGAAACGGDDEDNAATSQDKTATTTTTPPPAASGDLTITMSEFKFEPAQATVKAGKVKITAPNAGNAPHELVLLKTDADPAKLPKEGGEVDEGTSVGEIPDVEPGARKSASFELKPGKYAMVCALPGHYEAGMYGSLTVK